jgi:hypothetical protein
MNKRSLKQTSLKGVEDGSGCEFPVLQVPKTQSLTGAKFLRLCYAFVKVS